MLRDFGDTFAEPVVTDFFVTTFLRSKTFRKFLRFSAKLSGNYKSCVPVNIQIR